MVIFVKCILEGAIPDGLLRTRDGDLLFLRFAIIVPFSVFRGFALDLFVKVRKPGPSTLVAHWKEFCISQGISSAVVRAFSIEEWTQLPNTLISHSSGNHWSGMERMDALLYNESDATDRLNLYYKTGLYGRLYIIAGGS